MAQKKAKKVQNCCDSSSLQASEKVLELIRKNFFLVEEKNLFDENHMTSQIVINRFCL